MITVYFFGDEVYVKRMVSRFVVVERAFFNQSTDGEGIVRVSDLHYTALPTFDPHYSKGYFDDWYEASFSTIEDAKRFVNDWLSSWLSRSMSAVESLLATIAKR